jgi:molybdenum cofactor cytidylyltransferase
VIAGVLLAAGAGTRFGGAKLLAPLDGQPLALHALGGLATAVDVTYAVIRPGDAALRAVLERAGAQVLECADAHRGMGHSLACAARHAQAGAHLLVALADMPRVRGETMRAVAATLRAGAPVAVPVHAATRGHPVGFAAALRPELEALRGDAGGRALLGRYAAQIVEVPVDDPGALLDVDTPAALAALRT